jgi:hypothetical protein
MSSGVMLLHNNARPHAAARTQAMLQEYCWEDFEHPAYSTDLGSVVHYFFFYFGYFSI